MLSSRTRCGGTQHSSLGERQCFTLSRVRSQDVALDRATAQCPVPGQVGFGADLEYGSVTAGSEGADK